MIGSVGSLAKYCTAIYYIFLALKTRRTYLQDDPEILLEKLLPYANTDPAAPDTLATYSSCRYLYTLTYLLLQL